MSTRPWMLKNVSEEERSAATKAAAATGEPLGRWCGRKLLEAAQAELAPSRKRVLAPELAVQADTADRLLRLTEAADRLARLPEVRGAKGIRSAGFRLIREELRREP
jgi:hypothetical protein